MTDQYTKLREALAAGPTPGPWFVSNEVWSGGPIMNHGGCFSIVDSEDRDAANVICSRYPWDEKAPEMEANGLLIAAANPATITALFAERDAQAAEIERLRNALELFLSHSPEPGCAIWRHVHDVARAALSQGEPK